MLKIALHLAIRHLRKHPLFSFINLSGLSIGITASFLLLVYARREMSCDSQFRDADRIVRISADFLHMGGLAKSQLLLSPLLQGSCKDIAFATGLDKAHEEVPIRRNLQERSFKDIYPYYIDSSFFRVFSYKAAAGLLPQEGLAPGNVILTEEYAYKFFGKENPIGRTLFVGLDNTPCKVVAVLQTDLQPSHLSPQVLLPITTAIRGQYSDGWNSPALYNYVLLKDNGTVKGLNAWLDRLVKKIVIPSAGATVKFIVQPLKDIYFHSDLRLEISRGGNLTQTRMLSSIGLFFLLLAIINYVNLVTARSSARGRETGMQKTFGASRFQLIGQLLTSSLLFSLLAMLLAVCFIQGFLYCYHHFSGLPPTWIFILTPIDYGWLLVFSLLTGLIAGLYPAFYLTALSPLHAIRAPRMIKERTSPTFRNTLVLVQFSIAAALLLTSLVIYGQLQYINNKDKGFNGDGLLLVKNTEQRFSRAASLQQLIEQQPTVVGASFCDRTPGDSGISMITYFNPVHKEELTIQTFSVDDRYLATIGLHLSQGRNFDKKLITDTNALILNESAVIAMGLTNPIGATLNGSEKVIGVVKDFNYTSLKEKITPLILRYSPQGPNLAIRIRNGQSAAFISWLRTAGSTFSSEAPLTIDSPDEDFKRSTAGETLLSKVISFFSILAILLAAMGLIGLTLFNVERRCTEIGIRKVLGAAPGDLFALLAKDIFRRTSLATLLALPLSWWLLHRWLDNFAWRISIGLSSILITAIILLFLSLVITASITCRTILAPPAKDLNRK